MTTKQLLLLTLLVAQLSCGAAESPRDRAALISGLTIPSTATVVAHEEQWDEFLGDGHAWIVLELAPEAFRNLYLAAPQRGFRAIDERRPEFEEIVRRSRGVTEGLFKYSPDSRPAHLELTVLDPRTNRILVVMSYS